MDDGGLVGGARSLTCCGGLAAGRPLRVGPSVAGPQPRQCLPDVGCGRSLSRRSGSGRRRVERQSLRDRGPAPASRTQGASDGPRRRRRRSAHGSFGRRGVAYRGLHGAGGLRHVRDSLRGPSRADPHPDAGRLGGYPLRKDYGVGKVPVEFVAQPLLQIDSPGQSPGGNEARQEVDALGQSRRSDEDEDRPERDR